MALRSALFTLCLTTAVWLPAEPAEAAPPSEADLTAAAGKFQSGMEKLQGGDMSGLSDMRSAYGVLESALGRNAEPVVARYFEHRRSPTPRLAAE